MPSRAACHAQYRQYLLDIITMICDVHVIGATDSLSNEPPLHTRIYLVSDEFTHGIRGSV